MGMITRCPHCSTSFRITSELLKTHHGLVRCGNCSEVFNAFDSLSTLHDSPIPEAASEPAQVRDEHDFEKPLPAGEPAREESPLPEIEALPESSEEEFFVGEKPSKFRWAWGLGSALLFVSFLAQSFYQFRMEIGIAIPGMKPFLHDYCRLLECTVPLPGKAELIGIESSSLNAEKDRAGVIDLKALIRNGAPYAQAYPLIEITLTDAQDGPLARKVFGPSDYLRKDVRVEEGIPPDSAVNVSLDLDTGALQPSGYRLYLFYP